MLTYSKAEFELRSDAILNKIVEGSVFIHPTDTIYGLGCDATNSKAIQKLREVKSRYSRPFSVIVPDKTWIRDHCVVDANVIKWLKKLPGPYTLILTLKNKKAIAPEVNMGLDTVGVRLVDHWFQSACEKLGRPIITTSANQVGKEFMTSIEDLDVDIKAKTEFIIYEGEKEGKPSTIVDLTKKPEDIKER
jgi:L-threonylcarbamoyladenylate synthase